MAKAHDLVKGCLQLKGMTQSELARKLEEDPRKISQLLNRTDDIKFSRLEQILSAIGFRIMIEDIEQEE